MNLDNVKRFLDQFETCVIATVSKSGQPGAATVGFSVDEDLKIIIATNEKTKKASNIAENNRVALVIGFEGSKTVQIEGIAEKLDKETGSERIKLHFEKVPGAKKFAGETGQNYYLITPTWLRFTDYTQNPSIFETRSFA